MRGHVVTECSEDRFEDGFEYGFEVWFEEGRHDSRARGRGRSPLRCGPGADGHRRREDVVVAALSLEGMLAMRRVTGLALSPDGDRLVAGVQQLDDEGVRYVSALWEVDPAGTAEARRLTWSAAGESAPAFAADGSLLFTSTRPDPDRGAKDDGDDAPVLWRLPASGEAHPLASSPGGLAGPVTASAAPVFVVGTDRLPGASADSDAEWRGTRKKRKVTAVIHERFPIRYWDHELGPDFPRLLVGTVAGASSGADSDFGAGTQDSLREITPDPGAALVNAGYAVTPDGSTVVTDWYVDDPSGQLRCQLVVVDVATGERRLLVDEVGVDHSSPTVSPDGRTVAFLRQPQGDYETPLTEDVGVVALDGTGTVRLLGVGEELSPGSMAWSPDSRVLYACGNRGGRGTVLAVDLGTDPAGAARRHLASDAAYTHPCPSPDGRYVYALRSAVDCPPTPVRLDTALTDQEPVYLRSPAPRPELPGTLTEVSATAPDGATVRAWLVTPAEPVGGGPAPLQLWIHGGPFSSWNSWSWRWCPWIAAARGWAVLLPDPALSTGYGSAWLARGWPHRAATVWSDLQAVLDATLERDDVDAGRTACLGGSFGGYMTNWVAGHTDRFGAFVTHAGLWAADQQHTTTDAAGWKTALFGTPAEHPDWYAENSPHHFVDAISTPMLVIHGNRDYRVPYSEALRLWWDLVSHHTGDPDTLPHRFLQFPTENHWVLSPAHARIWNETVLAFLDWHVLGGQWNPPELA